MVKVLPARVSVFHAAVRRSEALQLELRKEYQCQNSILVGTYLGYKFRFIFQQLWRSALRLLESGYQLLKKN